MRDLPALDPGTPNTRSPAGYLRWIAGLHRGPLLLGMGYGILCMLAPALMPAAIGEAIDAGVGARDQGALLRWGAVVLLLGVVQAVAGILQDRSGVAASLGAAYRTLQLVTRQATRLGATLPKRLSTGDVVSAGVNDVVQIGGALEATGRAAGAVATIVVVTTIMLAASWQLGLVVLVGVPLMALATSLLIRPLHRRQGSVRAQQGELNSHAVDVVSGLRVLRGIGGEKAFEKRYHAESQRVRQAAARVARVEALLGGAKVLLPGLLVVVVVRLGAQYVLAGRITAGELVAFYGYAVFLATPLRRLTDAVDRFTRGHVAAQHVVRFLTLEPEAAPVTGRARPHEPAALADPVSGVVAAPGRFTAVVCASPADADALADRLGGYTPSTVTYGGVPLRELPLDEVRRRVLVTDNDARLFSGSLRTVLDPAGRAGDADEVWDRALDAASARDILEGLPGGLDGVVVGAGTEFSGGQRQRLRLVRALISDPEVLILVDPTSAVDAHTEARIAQRLHTARGGRATLVLTTSPLLLDRADHVLHVDAGKVVAAGTHGELLADPRYRSVVTREEEAA
ncbi:ABC transporter ATP-binding protein [Streptomyces syringium]|uniref:ABC transporter ATP-binding protein n=1 Tax=Streptomyces syringium TaxID=76729 RepID=UPI003655565F